MITLFWVSILFLNCAFGIPVDNGLVGEPVIDCGSADLSVTFSTRNTFEGHVFVKGHFSEDNCVNSETSGNEASISLPFDQCGLRRVRSLTPRGIFVSVTVIISFHPRFVTKVDRAYTVQCFYMEADKTVSTELEVSMLTTAFQTEVVLMPICRYEILDSAQGERVRYALVGQAVYHKWTCDTETVDVFCMTVHSCFVDDGQGTSVDLIDPNGCALDRYLLQNLDYLTDLMAGQEAHVFKYADRPQLYFQCQISITIKDPNTQCPLPQCEDPTRGKRSMLPESAGPTQQVMDVATEFITLDLEHSIRIGPAIADNFAEANQRNEDERICLAHSAFAALTIAGFTLLFSSLAVVIYLSCD